jgi:hypothetical protein
MVHLHKNAIFEKFFCECERGRGQGSESAHEGQVIFFTGELPCEQTIMNAKG